MFGLALGVVVIWLALPAPLAVPTFMMEGRTGFKAYRRAFFLVRHNWWRTLGLLIITGILSGVVSLIADGVFGVALRAAVSGGRRRARILVDFILFGVTYLCIHPFQGAVLVVLSIDLRVRKEGYDVALARLATRGRRLQREPSLFPLRQAATHNRAGIHNRRLSNRAATRNQVGTPQPGGYPQPGG